ncbi:PREDICTED: tRNA (guanine(9)-N1)-methyltransferase-like [Brassica oleracea var. oleracea]|uniref:tRNA (guanine(9)-N(1))-methyltransferase n=1 Tax=Brassica oleracea var. oleracea TaxID=109376 RepID=A0A0D3D9X4_BRAOL|nr:PREDICTED: tRNA (guanine(9)-N1)-methyltransferase-like [Brassica oleracea var. oleracea]
MAAATENDDNGVDNHLKPAPVNLSPPAEQKPLSKNAHKKQLKQQRYEAKKAEKKAQEKEHKRKEGERKHKEWEETLSNATEEERLKLIESRKSLRKERMDKRSEEKEKKMERLTRAKEIGQNVVVDVDFAHLMSESEISSLVQQIMYCYAVNGRSTSPCHLWLTGIKGEMSRQLDKLPGFEKWFIEKESRCYIEAMADRKESLVYLTADSETVLDELDPKSIYIIGGLVDRNRFKGITMNKAQEQGIKTAKLPIGEYMKMSSSQVLTVNQVVEILVKFLETRDWKTSFFTVIPQRKRTGVDPISCSEEHQEKEGDEDEKHDLLERKKLCVEVPLESGS